MKIKRLFIKDFGIFNNQLMEDIGPGLVVIGGHNRAGKTTFMQLLRHIAFGFPRKDNFIFSRDKHEVEVICSINENQEIIVYLQGYSNPIIKGNDEVLSTSEIYNNLDPFTYQQLFTISLDELQNCQINNNKKERLQSILLGAGLKEFILLPQLEDFFNKEAEKIGGKNGDPKVKDFKPYYLKIKDGVELQDKASQQVEKFHNKQQELEKLNESIGNKKSRKRFLEDELYRLDILKNNYDIYTEINRIENRLLKDEAGKYLGNDIYFYPERAKDLLNKYNEKKQVIKQLINKIKEKYSNLESLNSIDSISERVYRYKEEIEQLKEKIASIQAKVKFYYEKEKNLIKEEKELKFTLLEINEDWQGELDEINEIKTDQIQFDLLKQQINKFKKLSSNLEREEDNLQEYQERKNYLEKSINDINIQKPTKVLGLYFIGSIISILTGFLLSSRNRYFTFISLAGIIGLTIYSLYKYTIDKSYHLYLEKSNIEIHNIDLRIRARQKKIKDYRKMLVPLENKLNQYKNLLGLSKNSSHEFIKEYYKDVQQIKGKANNLKMEKVELNRNFFAIEEELKNILGLLNNFPEIFNLDNIDQEIELYLQDHIIFSMVKQLIDFKDNIMELFIWKKEIKEFQEELKKLYRASDLMKKDFNEDIAILLEEYLTHCERYHQYYQLKDRMEQLVEQVKAVLNTEAVRKAMNGLNIENNNFKEKMDDREELYGKFVYLYNQFLSVESVEESYNKKRLELEKLIEDLERDEKNLITIRRELDELATDEALKKSSLLIDEGRKELAYLAEEYAINKAAAFILKKVRKTFIQQTRDKLLAGASKYFREITRGEYKAVLPPENILEGDFQAVLRDGTIQDSTELLSRGTMEQLFLAIRISRIKEIEPALPVIIDDSFVNFDNYHLTETLTLIRELADTHQIFLLTCHPHLIEFCQEDIPIQYWKLANGHFTKTSKDKLLDYLRVG